MTRPPASAVTSSGLPSGVSASTCALGLMRSNLLAPSSGGSFSQAVRLLSPEASCSMKCRAPSRLLGTILSGPGKCSCGRIGSPYLLRSSGVHHDRQQVGQRRLAVAAGGERVQSAQHQQPGPLMDHAGQGRQFVRPQRFAIDVADDVDVVFAAGEVGLEVERPLAGVAFRQTQIIHLDVGRSVERAAEKLLFHAQRPFEIEDVQPPFEHGDERAQLVVGGDDFARLLFGPHGQLVFAGRVGNVAHFNRMRDAVLGRVAGPWWRRPPSLLWATRTATAPECPGSPGRRSGRWPARPVRS